MLVLRHRLLIERVAKTLLARTTLNRKQLDQLVGRSVDDVRMNAPYLLLLAKHSRGARRQPRRDTDATQRKIVQ
jgi:hypothetical protein